MPGLRSMRIVIATVRVPFVDGGAEIHAAGLRQALLRAGHCAEIVSIPFKWYPPERILDQILACRLLDLSESIGVPVDRLIGLKFPAYLIPHPRKTLWIIHQHRQAYDLWQHPLGDLHTCANGEEVRAAIHRADTELIPQAQSVFTNSRNVALRLKAYCGLAAAPLYHPPRDAELFYNSPAGDFFYFPSRINPLKRQELVLRALAFTRQPVKVCFSGPAAERAIEEACHTLARENGCAERVRWMGEVSEEEKRDLYARSLGVLFPPIDEDYGYVTLEAMLAGKPVITCKDSGGPLEFVVHGETGIVAEPAPEALAAAMDELWDDRQKARRWGLAARQRYADLEIGWDHVVERLLE